jgi:hypothetical protein
VYAPRLSGLDFISGHRAYVLSQYALSAPPFFFYKYAWGRSSLSYPATEAPGGGFPGRQLPQLTALVEQLRRWVVPPRPRAPTGLANKTAPMANPRPGSGSLRSLGSNAGH